MPRQRAGQIGEYWLSRNRHGTWCRTWFDAQTRQTRRAALGAADFDSAMIALAKWYTLNTGLEKEAPSDVPLAVALDRYYEKHAKALASGAEADRAVRYAKAFFGLDAAVADLTLERQREFEVWLRTRGGSDAYIARIQTTLKAAVNRAYREQEIATAPYVRVIASAAQRTRLLSLQEAAALFNAEPPEHLVVFLMLAFNTLARPEALLELQPFQLDFERRLLALNPAGRVQTRKHRPTLPITDTLLPWLQARAAQRYVVQWYEGQPQPIDSIKTTWRKVRDRAKLSADVVPYTIRHTMATELRRRGVDEWEVKGWLGHRGRGETDRYAKFAPDYLAAGATAIDAYMNELQPLVKRELILGNVTSLRGRKA
jgi:integrase